MSITPPPNSPYYNLPERQSVVITDVDMTIGAMCRFMVKWVIAAIPAAIILWLLTLAVVIVCAFLFGGLIGGLAGIKH